MLAEAPPQMPSNLKDDEDGFTELSRAASEVCHNHSGSSTDIRTHPPFMTAEVQVFSVSGPRPPQATEIPVQLQLGLSKSVQAFVCVLHQAPSCAWLKQPRPSRSRTPSLQPRARVVYITNRSYISTFFVEKRSIYREVRLKGKG